MSQTFEEKTKRYAIPELPQDSFDWLRWIRGLGIWTKLLKCRCRFSNIVDRRNDIRSLAVGFIDGEKLWCRPKSDEVAVMFIVDDEFAWTHLTRKEFEYVFGQDWILYSV